MSDPVILDISQAVVFEVPTTGTPIVVLTAPFASGVSGGGGTAATTTFTPDGSIAATDVQAAVQEVRDEAERLFSFNVKTYGAVGNGTTDDTTAVQAAYTAAAVAGGVVLFPAGSYKITTTLTRAKSVRLVGLAGSIGSTAFYPTLLWAGSSGGTIETITATGSTTPAPRDTHMKWDGGGTNGAPLAAHATTSADRLDWDYGSDHCAFVRFQSYAISLAKGAVNARWHDCRFDAIGDYAIYASDGNSGFTDNYSITGGTWDGYGPTSGGAKGFLLYSPQNAGSSAQIGVHDFRMEINGPLVISAATRPFALVALDLDVISDPICQATVTLDNVMVTDVNTVGAGYQFALVGQTGPSNVRQWTVTGSGVHFGQHTAANGSLLVDGAGIAGPPSGSNYPLFVFDPMHTQGAGTNSTEYDSNVWIGPGAVTLSGALTVAGTFSGSYANQGTLTGPRGGGAESQLLAILGSTGLYTDATSAIYGETTSGTTLSGFGVTGVDATGAARTPKALSATAARLGFEYVVFKMDATANTVTVGVQTGEYLNSTINGTVVLSGQGDFVRLRCVERGFGSGTYMWLIVGRTVTGGGTGDALVANPLSQFAATTSLQLKNTISDETGSGALVFGTSPALTTPTGIVKGDVGLGSVDNTADTAKPVSTAQQTALNLKANLASPTFTGTVTVPTPSGATDAASKGYVDTAVTGLLDFKGATDCSANPNYPAASKGDIYIVSVAGKIGGASGKSVDIGDTYLATADNAGGTEASVGTSWAVLEHNLTGVALTSGTLAQFAATTSAQLAALLSDETGSGAAVFGTSPTLVTPALGTPSAVVLTNATGLPESGVTGLVTDLGLKAPLASPTFTGTVTVPTPSNATDPTTKTYVDTADALKLAKASNLSDLANAATSRTNLAVEGYGYTAKADIDYTAVATDAWVVYTSLTAARVLTLPAASAVPAGWRLLIEDGSGSCSATNTITITRAGADTISGATTEVMNAPYTRRILHSDGVSKWLFDAGIVRLNVAQTLTAKTLTSPVLNTGVSGTAVDTDATMAANSDTLLPSQKAVKTALAGKVSGLVEPYTTYIEHYGGQIVPKRSLDRFAAGAGIKFTTLNGAITNSATSLTLTNANLLRTGLAQVVRIDDEELFVTAGMGTTSLTVVRGANGTTAVSHLTLAPVRVSTVTNVCIVGDSIAQGTVGSFDTYTARLRRMLGTLMGGSCGLGFQPVWRCGGSTISSVVSTNTASEWAFTGTWTSASSLNDYDFAPFAHLYVGTAGTGNYAVWTRPADATVYQIDVYWADIVTASTNLWSYSVDGGSTWVNNPNTATNPATSTLKKTKITVNNPADFRVRAANAAGTGSLTYLVGIDVWNQVENFGTTTGVKIHNFGFDGQSLQAFTRSRTITVGTTNTSPTITSAALFATGATGDIGYNIRGTGIPASTTISTVGTTSSLTASANATATGSVNGWIQGTHGDWAALFDGQRASLVPDLIIGGPFSNDASNAITNGGQNDTSFGYALDTFHTRFSYCDRLMIAPFEQGGVRLNASESTAAIQTLFRAKMKSQSAAYNVANMDLYDAYVAEGYTGYAAADTLGSTVASGSGLMGDTFHPSALGYRDSAARVVRLLAMFGPLGGTDNIDQFVRKGLFTAANQILASTASATPAAITAPTITGQRLSFDGTNLVYTHPQGIAVVAADVTHTQSNTTLSDVTGLLVPIGASATEIWFWEAFLLVVAASATVDTKWGFTVPTAATMKWGLLGATGQIAGFSTGNTAASVSALLTESGSVAIGSANVTFGVSLAGMIFGGGTAGNVQLQFAQNTSEANNLTVQKGSILRYTRIVA